MDSLLGLAASLGASELVVASGEVPAVETAKGRRELSMPEIRHEMVTSFLERAMPPGARAPGGAAGPLDTAYRSADGRLYGLRVEQAGGKLRLIFRAQPAAAAVPAPRDPPPPAAPAGEPEPLPALLAQVESRHASDLIVSPGADARLRVSGTLVELPHSRCAEDSLLALVEPALGDGERRELDATGSVDVGVDLALPGGRRRFRVNLFRQRGGLAAAFRPIRDEIPTLRDLNLPDRLYALCDHAHGLVLVTGPAGSGKSTTLVSLIEHVNRTRACHVITLENPIEYEYRPKRALIHQREVGRHVDSFFSGLRAALRESPDVVLVGEMRDPQTVEAALTAAETGHLVLSTLHSGNASLAVSRILDLFPQHQQDRVRVQLAGVLRAVLAQSLLPSTRLPLRVPAFELLVGTSGVAHLIRENRVHQLASLIQTGRAEGMIPLELSLARLLRSSLVDAEVARAAANDPNALDLLLRGGD